MQNWIAIVGPAKRRECECKLDLIPGQAANLKYTFTTSRARI